MRRRLGVAGVSLLLLVGVGCAPKDNSGSPAPTTGSSTGSTSPTASTDPCAVASLPLVKAGQLTVATDSPAYDPWFSGDNPSNGKGYESAVAYAIADRMGFSKDQVHWVKEPFNNSYKPGPKNFDFDINEISISADRAKAVDFSDGYYTNVPAVIGLKGTPIASATSIADLAKYKLAAQTGSTSLTTVRDLVKPSQAPVVTVNTNIAVRELKNQQVDGVVVDLYTAFYITGVQLSHSTIIGQLQPTSGKKDQFGLLFQKGNKLVTCVNAALASLRTDGSLAAIENQWLSTAVNVPVLK